MSTIEGLALTETILGRRYYNIEDSGIIHKLPSVTTIISAMTDHSGLDEWRKRVGEEEAERISKFGRNRGTIMHQKIEFFCMSEIQDIQERKNAVNEQINEFAKNEGFTQAELDCGNLLFNKLYICGFFNKIKNIIEMEEPLYSFVNGGWAGRCDCIYEDMNGQKVLLDFKTSRKPKRRDWITDYFLQLSAYFESYRQLRGVELDRAELWIAVEDGSPQIIEISKAELKSWLKHFLELTRLYHEKYDYLLEPVENKIQKNKIETIGKIKIKHLI